MVNKESFSFVIPTFKEEQIIFSTIEKLNKEFPNSEIIVVDDSPDDKTGKEVNRAKREFGVRVIYIKNSPPLGLSGSVLKAIKTASFSKIVVIDSDLQHPLEVVPKILEKLENNLLVLAEREDLGKSLSFRRKILSYTAVLFANIRLILSKKNTFKDPVTGFFGIRKEALSLINEKRVVFKGWKICFDLLKQFPPSKVSSIGYRGLNKREKGSSKYNYKVGFYFILSLIS